MKIRTAALGDEESCLRLSQQEKEHYWSKEDFQRSVKDKNVVFVVEEEEGRVIGYSLGFIIPTKRIEALLHETRVDLEFRGQKVGTKLVDAVCKALFSRGARVIYAMIAPKHKPFYIKSCCFKETGDWIEVARRRR